MELPADETGLVPVEYVQSEPRYYGVTPTTLVLVLAGVAFTLAIVLFALGFWPFALIALSVCVVLVLIFVEAARRKPDGVVARSTADALDGFRARAGMAADSLARGVGRPGCSPCAASSSEWACFGPGFCSSWEMRCTVGTTKRRTPPAARSESWTSSRRRGR